MLNYIIVEVVYNMLKEERLDVRVNTDEDGCEDYNTGISVLDYCASHNINIMLHIPLVHETFGCG